MIDLAELVGQYTNLQRVGARFFGACPFCNEATYFRVDPLEDAFRCFACGVQGDALDFAALVAKG